MTYAVRGALNALGALLIGVAVAFLIVGYSARLFVYVVYPECRNAPKYVPYTPGMTLCPGQTATFRLDIPETQPERDPKL